MMKNKSRLILPQHFTKENSQDKNDFFHRVYLNALQYYVDDPTHDLENISLTSMFLYSMGDKYIKLSPKLKLDEIGNQKIANPSKEVEKDINFYSKNLVSALQFRLLDRKYVLDVNTYSNNKFKDFLDVDIMLNDENKHELFTLIMRNFKLKYFTSLEKKESADIFLNKLNENMEESDFNGIFDDTNFQDRYLKANDNRQIFELDGYFKTELKEWQAKFDKKSLLDSLVIDKYPYIDGILYDNNKYFVVIALKEKDDNYIDDKTEDINKVFECSMFIYLNESDKIKVSDLPLFKDSLRFRLGRFIKDCSLDRLQNAMNGAIGEASDISRHWYSKGLDSIFNTEAANIFKNDEDSINFYTSFIEKLLCKIEGINNTEIYPFDRVFIFPETGLDNTYVGISHMTVLEAKIKSKEPFDRGSYLIGWEQDVEDEDGNKILDEANDLVFSDKKINRANWKLGQSDVFLKGIETVNKKYIKGNLLLSNLLLDKSFLNSTLNDKTKADYKKLANLKRKIRDDFNEYGLFYEYEFGLNLAEQYPILKKVQDVYFDKMLLKHEEAKRNGFDYNEANYNQNFNNGKYRGVSKEALINNLKVNIQEHYKSKVVTVCFDPERITKPELAGTIKYLKRKDAITMVFVADKDFVKTTSELQAEIEDFKVLIQMVIRQVIYSTESAETRNIIQKEVLGLIPHTLHDIKSLVKDEETQNRIDELFTQLKEKLDIGSDKTENKPIVFESNNVYSEILNRLFENKVGMLEPIDLQERVKEWLPQKHNISISLHESFLPKMKMPWEEIAVPKAFKVVLKNAAEYCGMYFGESNDGKLTLSMTTESTDNIDFLVINIINTTPSITKSRFEILNNEQINEAGKDIHKKGSTGIGVVQARRQLKSINSLNTIAYTMLSSNVISAKIYLKIELLSENNLFLDESISFTTQNTLDDSTMLTEYDIVYFEDSSEYYNPNLTLLNQYNMSVVHSVRKDEKFMPNAKILLTDMSILNDAGVADEIEGLEGIELFINNNVMKAPICVLSNGEAFNIRDRIIEHLEGSIHSDDVVIVKDFKRKMENGRIFILNNVKVLDKKHTIVFDYLKSISKLENFENDTSTQQNVKNYELVQFLDTKTYTVEFENVFSKIEKEIAENYFYVANVSNSENSLVEIVEKWFTFKTARVNNTHKKYSVSNVTYHKNLLLIVDTLVIEDEREKWWLFYLGISHNIVFNFLGESHESILAQWSDIAVKREASGYLGKLRHDVKNYYALYEKKFKNSNLNKEFEKIITNTLELQRLLQLSQYESLNHFTLYAKGTKLADVKNGEVLKIKVFDAIKQSKQVENIMYELRSSLTEVLKIMQSNLEENTNIKNLQKFIDLINFNITFCTKRG